MPQNYFDIQVCQASDSAQVISVTQKLRLSAYTTDTIRKSTSTLMKSNQITELQLFKNKQSQTRHIKYRGASVSAEIRYICSRRVTLTLIVPQSTKGFPRLSGWCWRVIKERSMNFHQQSCIIRPQPNRDRLVAHRQTIPCVLNPKFHLQILHK